MASSGLLSRRVVPGLGLSLGYTVLWLSLVVLIPLSTLATKSASLTVHQFWTIVSSPMVRHAYLISFGCSLAAGVVNAAAGLLVAWVLVRYAFPGRRIVDAMIDLPFALPTAVAGIALTSLYKRDGWIGSLLTRSSIRVPWPGWNGFGHGGWPLRIDWYPQIAFSPAGVTVALIFIGLPFVVRTVQPVLEDLGTDIEEAALSLGASRWQTFRRVLFPELWPAVLSGFSLAVARSIGEYGSVVYISGNLPMRTEIASGEIITKLEQYNYPGATAISLVMLVASFGILAIVSLIDQLTVKR